MHAPVEGSQLPDASKQLDGGSWHDTGLDPTHVPAPSHVEVPVHASPSSQRTPTGAGEYMHSPVPGLQVPVSRKHEFGGVTQGPHRPSDVEPGVLVVAGSESASVVPGCVVDVVGSVAVAELPPPVLH